MSDYDYVKYEEMLQRHLDEMWRDPEELEIGENISNISEIKIIFDGYGDLETEDEEGNYVYKEGGNTNMESYAIFIHKDALTEGFMFPEHDSYAFTFGSMLQHRPAEEVCIYAWYDVENDSWDVLPLEDRLDGNNKMNEEDVMKVLEGLYDYYYKPWEGKFENDPSAWPFK